MFRRLLDPLVPCSCWACGRPCGPAAALCGACSAALPWRAPQARPAAGLDAAWAGLEFAGPARSLVHALKFRGALVVAGLMAAQLAERAPPALLVPGRPLVPVPAHPGRRRRRGFDPAQLLARELAALTGVPVLHVLLRRGGPRDAQRGSGRSERLAGEHLAMTARTPVRGGVVLVDDVWTTGATLRACAGALRAAGAAQVCAIAYARASGGAD